MPLSSVAASLTCSTVDGLVAHGDRDLIGVCGNFFGVGAHLFRSRRRLLTDRGDCRDGAGNLLRLRRPFAVMV